MRNSNKLYEEASKVTPLGTQTLSKAPSRYVQGVYPKLLESGKGCTVKDVDGHSYVDYIAGLGPILLGYADDRVDNAVKAQIDKGVLFSLPNKLEGEIAMQLNLITDRLNMWKFTKTGSDACTMAVKIARAYTKRNNVVACGYHGFHDWFSIVNDKKLGIPADNAKYIKKAKYNNLDSFEIDDQTACVIMEPEVFDAPQTGFLEAVKEKCHKHGAVLIFDEVVTGFRYPKFLAQNYYGIIPDLTVLSKGIANGYPMAAVGGWRHIMGVCESNDFFASTTFGGDCVGLAATKAVLHTIPFEIDWMMASGRALKQYFNQLFEGKAFCKGFPTRTMFDFPTSAHKALFWQECCKHGVLFGYSNFVMAAHNNEVAEEILYSALDYAALTVLSHWSNPASKLEGKMPVEVFRLLRN